jgi:hypothetical protein
VVMHRAAFLAREVFHGPDDRILVTTFTRNLAYDVQQQLEKLLEPEELARVEVINIDAWAAQYLKACGHPLRLATRDACDRGWRSALDLHGVDGFDRRFCQAEWECVIQEQDLRDEQAYARAVRKHRGLPLSRPDRRRLWAVFDEYRASLETQGVAESVDILRAARKRLEVGTAPPAYRSVVVDETQDFSTEALRLVRAIAGPEHPDDLFLVGDAHQRIYGRPAPLSQCGINIRGRRSRELRINYRTTAAICRWAFRTLGAAEFDDLDDGKVRGKGYVSLRAGEKPIVRHFSNAAEEYAFVAGEIRQLLEQGVNPESICVVARLGNLLSDGIGPALAKAGIDHEILDKNKPRTGCVRLATMHRVKGLEFPAVFVTCVNDGILPLASLVDSDDPVVAEQAHARERCLLYVAASRARDTLYVVSHGIRSPLLDGLDELDVAITREEARARTSPPEASAPPSAKPADTAAEPASGSDAEADPLATLLAEPVNSWPLPVRTLNWCERKEILSVGQLVSYSPVGLLSERNVGRKTVAETRALLEARLGATWEELRRFVRGEQASPADGSRAEPVRFRSAWDRIRAELPMAFADTPVAEVGLPARMESYCSRQGIRTLAALVKVERSVLLAAKNVGRTTVATTEKAVLEFIETSEARRAAWSEGLLSSWKAWMRDLDAIPRMVLARRAGLAGEPETLDSIGETLGVSRERIRQIEAKHNKELQAQTGWKEFVLDRFRNRLDSLGAVPLTALEADPWWTGLSEQPQVLIYFCKRLLDDAFTVVTVGEADYLAAAAQSVVDGAWSRLLEVAEAEPLPAPLSQFEALARREAEALGPVLAEALFEQLQDHLQLDDPSLSAPTVLAFGAGKRSQVIALLAASETPVPVNELVAKVGRFNLPEDLLYFDRHLVGLKKHFPDFDLWLEKVVPVVVSVMESSGPDRQWSCVELIDDIREALEIPEWMNHWHLSSLLRNSNRVTYLGRFRVALPGVAEVGGRVHVRDHLQRILKEAGAPLGTDELLSRAREAMDFQELHARFTMLRAPFLKCDEDTWGLTERDLPGGSEAADAAIEHIETVLQRRERGLTAHQVQRQIQTLSESHAQWTQAMCLSVLRASPALRLSHGGNVGLSEWETVRVPSRTDLIASCLDEGGGRVSLDAIQARIEALYGSRPTRADVTGMAAKVRGRMAGEWVLQEGGVSRALP